MISTKSHFLLSTPLLCIHLHSPPSGVSHTGLVRLAFSKLGFQSMPMTKDNLRLQQYHHTIKVWDLSDTKIRIPAVPHFSWDIRRLANVTERSTTMSSPLSSENHFNSIQFKDGWCRSLRFVIVNTMRQAHSSRCATMPANSIAFNIPQRRPLTINKSNKHASCRFQGRSVVLLPKNALHPNAEGYKVKKRKWNLGKILLNKLFMLNYISYPQNRFFTVPAFSACCGWFTLKALMVKQTCLIIIFRSCFCTICTDLSSSGVFTENLAIWVCAAQF